MQKRKKFKYNLDLIEKLTEENAKLKEEIQKQCKHYLIMHLLGYIKYEEYYSARYVCVSCGHVSNHYNNTQKIVLIAEGNSEPYEYISEYTGLYCIIKNNEYERLEKKHEDHIDSMTIKDIIE